MADLGDIFDMVSNGDDENKSQNRKIKQDGTEDTQSGGDIKSLVLKKITQNKMLLVGTIVGGIFIVGIVAFIVIKYIGANGINNIIDGIKPFTG